MSRETWNTVNDLVTLFTARLIAVPLLCLLGYKIYLIAPEALIYVISLSCISALLGLRWGLRYLALHPRVFASHFNQLKKQDTNQD